MDLGDAEVAEEDGVVVVKEDVLGLEVTVYLGWVHGYGSGVYWVHKMHRAHRMQVYRVHGEHGLEAAVYHVQGMQEFQWDTYLGGDAHHLLDGWLWCIADKLAQIRVLEVGDEVISGANLRRRVNGHA